MGFIKKNDYYFNIYIFIYIPIIIKNHEIAYFMSFVS